MYLPIIARLLGASARDGFSTNQLLAQDWKAKDVQFHIWIYRYLELPSTQELNRHIVYEHLASPARANHLAQ